MQKAADIPFSQNTCTKDDRKTTETSWRRHIAVSYQQGSTTVGQKLTCYFIFSASLSGAWSGGCDHCGGHS